MPDKKRTCFVVMGFGEKTDYSTGRVLNLDASYKHVIKPGVEAAGLECIRADEITHSGVIDVPMYQQLLNADVVIADLSTGNANAFYELGVRHALRPFTTIVISESQLKYPFDINHTAIRTYEHLGKDIGFGEAERFQRVLKQAIEDILKKQENDSPVYTYLSGLNPPQLAEQAASVARMAAAAGLADGAPAAEAKMDTTVSFLMERALALKNSDKFAAARDLFKTVCELCRNDTYAVQQLALTTYKAKEPDAISALVEAKKILEPLSPRSTVDPETLGLWSAIHKRLWELKGDRADLEESIRASEKGFYIKNDYYNGINLAFLLNVRASISPPADAIADWVAAGRVRQRVLTICDAAPDASVLNADDRYWVAATVAEAWFGLEKKAEHEEALAKAFALAGADWMKDSTRDQLKKLSALLERSPLQFLTPQSP